MRTIWKHPLMIADAQTIMVPRGADLLTVQYQGSVPTLWMLVDPDAPKVHRTLVIVGTGHPMPAGLGRDQYVGTLVDQEAVISLVWHVFDAGEVGGA